MTHKRIFKRPRFRERIFLFWLVAVLACLQSPAQVANNEISRRIRLDVNEAPIQSTTARSNVQADCINKSLTAACLVYHNDQWFTFTVPVAGRYYLNFNEQDCLEKRGIQVLLLEGDPCVVQTYSVIECISRLGMDDTYVVLDSLKPNIRYLLNIDGFLGDQCSFTVQIADHASGFPHRPATTKSSAEFLLRDSVVTMRIRVDPNELLHYSEIRVYRKYADNDESLFTSIQPGRANALGDYQSEYEFHDTLSAVGTYRYRAYAVRNESQELTFLGERQLPYYGVSSASQFVQIPAPLRSQKEVRVRIIHPPDGKTLDEYVASGQAGRVGVEFKKYIKAGYRNFAVEFSAPGREKVHVSFFRASTDNHVSRIE